MKAQTILQQQINFNKKWIMQAILALSIIGIFQISAYAQLPPQKILAEWEFENTKAAHVHDPNLIASKVHLYGVGDSAMVNAACTQMSFEGGNWTTSTSIDTTQYFEFTVEAKQGFRLQLLRLQFDSKIGNTGPVTGEVRSNLDGFAEGISPFPAFPHLRTFEYDSTACKVILLNLAALGPNFSNEDGPVTFRIYAYGASAPGIGNKLNLDNLKIFGQVVPGGPLPIELISFTASAEHDVVRLDWSTAEEVNNEYFTLERSRDGRSFEVLGTVEGAGNSAEILSYTYNDVAPIDGTSYYRLKQTDLNGEYSYSNIVPVKMRALGGNINIYPNPVISNVNVEVEAPIDGQYDIEVLDLSGRAVVHQQQYLKKGDQQWSMPMDQLSNGTYILRISSGQDAYTRKFIKN